MVAILDTGPLIGFLDRDDALHPQAVDVLGRVTSGRYGLVASTDYVLDEGLTLIQRRRPRQDLSRAFANLFLGMAEEGGGAFETWTTEWDLVREAIRLHFRHYDRRLSLTDCTLLAHAERTGAVIVTFDGRFDGIVPTVR